MTSKIKIAIITTVSILLCTAVSTSAGAIDWTQIVKRRATVDTANHVFYADGTYQGVAACNDMQDTSRTLNITTITGNTGTSVLYRAGEYVQITYTVYNWNYNDSGDYTMGGRITSTSSFFELVDVRMQAIGNSSARIDFILYVLASGNYNNYSLKGWDTPIFGLKYRECLIPGQINIYTTEDVSPEVNVNVNQQDVVNAIQNQTNQQTNAGQQAQQDGQNASNQAQTSTTQGTQSLLSAITGFVGVITSASPTNCTISGNMGNVDIGTLDFCRDNPPPLVTTIGTIILIGVTIPLVIWVVKKIISMFRSFTNG